MDNNFLLIDIFSQSSFQMNDFLKLVHNYMWKGYVYVVCVVRVYLNQHIPFILSQFNRRRDLHLRYL